MATTDYQGLANVKATPDPTDIVPGQVPSGVTFRSTFGALYDRANHTGGSVGVAISVSGKPLDGQKVAVTLPYAVSFPTGLSGSYGRALTAASAETVISLQDQAGSEWGTVTFAASSTTATFASGSGKSFSAGDTLVAVFAATADAALSDIGLTLRGDR